MTIHHFRSIRGVSQLTARDSAGQVDRLVDHHRYDWHSVTSPVKGRTFVASLACSQLGSSILGSVAIVARHADCLCAIHR